MHKTVVIICDGQFPKSEYPRYLIRTADFIICCDGALKKFLRNSTSIFGSERLPDLVIGDMDSLSESMKQKYSDIIVKVDEQEHNDQTKAFRWTLDNLSDVGHIQILGATGQREDHTIGNMSLLMGNLNQRYIQHIRQHFCMRITNHKARHITALNGSGTGTDTNCSNIISGYIGKQPAR